MVVVVAVAMVQRRVHCERNCSWVTHTPVAGGGERKETDRQGVEWHRKRERCNGGRGEESCERVVGSQASDSDGEAR